MTGINSTLLLIVVCLAATVKGAAINCTILNTPSVVIGNYAALCLTVQYTNSSATTNYYYLYKVKIDQFTSLRLNGLSNLLKSSSATSASLNIQFQNQPGGQDFPILNTSASVNIQRSVISAVINTVNGGYSSIANDAFCDSSCGNCYYGECFDTFSSYSSPDLKVYISWAGSDSSNNQYLSGSQRLSRFNLYSVSSLYSSVKNIYTS